MTTAKDTAVRTRPVRIQRKRTPGWRMPPDTVSVTRPGLFGNPFTAEAAIDSGYATPASAAQFVVGCFRDWLGPSHGYRDWWQGPEGEQRRKAILDGLKDIRGKNLACFCKLLDRQNNYVICHADVLLSLANNIPIDEVIRENTRRAKGETL